MKRLAPCLALLLLLGGCAHLDGRREPVDTADECPPRHLVLVVCIFASCHHLTHPHGGPGDTQE